MTFKFRKADNAVGQMAQSQLFEAAEKGAAFEVSSIQENIAIGGGEATYLFETGSKGVFVALREVRTDGDNVTYQVTAGVSATHGTNVTPTNRNAQTGIPATVIFSTAPTGVSGGTPIQPEWIPGSTGQGNTSNGQFSISSLGRVLTPNTKYLLTVTNDGTNPLKTQVYVTWVEYDLE